MRNIIYGKLAGRPASAPAGTIFIDIDTNIYYEYDNGEWSIYPGENVDAKIAAVDAKVAALTARVAELEGAVIVTVTFNSDGGSSVSAQTIAYGSKATEPDDPTKEDYTFSGWFLGEATSAFDFNTIIKKSITLTAHWTASE